MPDYVEELEPNVAPQDDKVFVTGQRDQFYLSWWRGGRLWTRDALVDLAPSPVDENVTLTVVEHTAPEMRRFIPPFNGAGYLLRPAGWPNAQAGYLVYGDLDTWLSYNLSNAANPTTLSLAPGYLRATDRFFGPTSPSAALLVGQLDGRVHAVGPQEGSIPRPLENETQTCLPVLPMGHLWLFAYEDGHCTTFTADEGVDQEVGNWRCFADAQTRVLQRSLASDTQGPVMVRHETNTLQIWDPVQGSLRIQVWSHCR